MYGVSLITVNYLSFSYMFWFIPINFPSTYVLDTYGLRIGIILGYSIFGVGVCLSCLVNTSFWYVILGQTLSGIGEVFIYNALIKVSENWFPANERVTATMTGSLAFTFGVLFGYLVPKLFIRPSFNAEFDYTESERNEFKTQV